MLPKVDIIMATYNGEKYLENQILSLIQQSYKNWQLIIHDDGSTDKTKDVIEKYVGIDDRVKFIQDDVTDLRAGKNFIHTLNFSTSDYAIFCDQDDIWLETKIEELMQKMLIIEDKDKPTLIYCDGYPWNREGKIEKQSISTCHAEELNDFIMLNGGYQGCSILMNRKLIEMTQSYHGYIYHHDDLVSLIAHTFGKVHFYPKQLMLYRQHTQAVTGEKSFKKRVLGGIFENAGYVISNKHYRAKKSFFEFYKSELAIKNKRIFEAYFNYCETESKLLKVFIVLNNNLTWGKSRTKLIGKSIVQRTFDI